MDRGLVGQRRYLAALEAAAAASPAACANQLAALARERALAAAAADGAGYRAASGDLIELGRGQWLDRLVGHARTAAALDDPWAVAAARLELEATLGARGGAAWSPTLIAASAVAEPVRARGQAATSAYAQLVWAVVRAHAEGRPIERAEASATAAAARAELRTIDPGFDPRALAPRYRWRTPWTGAGLAALAGWIDAAGGAPAAPAPVPDGRAELAAIDAATAARRASLPGRGGGPVGDAEPTVADVVTPYVALARLPGDAPEVGALRAVAAALIAAADGAVCAQDVLAGWAERGLLVELARAPIEAGLVRARDRLAVWPEPLVAAHVERLAHELSGCRTSTEVDLVHTHAQACLAVEADWNRALAGGLLAPALAAFVAGWAETAEARRGVSLAWQVAGALTGAGAELLDLPWVTAVLRDVVVRHGGAEPDALGAHLGEIGADLLGEARAAIACARARGELTALDPRSLGAWLRRAAPGAPPPAPRPVRLWDHAVALDDVHAAAALAARPGRFGPGVS